MYLIIYYIEVAATIKQMKLKYKAQLKKIISNLARLNSWLGKHL